jgi:hypothetical protein
MRELEALIDKHGFAYVLSAYSTYMGSKITPTLIGFELVNKQARELYHTARYLDNTKPEWSKK